jgi:hypothetical protein
MGTQSGPQRHRTLKVLFKDLHNEKARKNAHVYEIRLSHCTPQARALCVNSGNVEPPTNLKEAVPSVNSKSLNVHETLLIHGSHKILDLCNHLRCAAFLRLQSPPCGDIYIAV